MSSPFLLEKNNLFIFCFFLLSFNVIAQNKPSNSFKTLSTRDLNGFKPAQDNWKIVGDVKCDSANSRAIETTPGLGILANVPKDKSYGDKFNLYTQLQHGDIELELDFMMAKNSNSGVYFQGRYEIQLYDSWKEKNLTSKDVGSIYERWNENQPEGKKGYEGHAPKTNVAKAPGEWQHLVVSFQAPRFDTDGKKIANARFNKVILNGVVLHTNVEVTGPTRAAGFDDETPEGPLMIQGDHGPVAFRNIRYKSQR